MDRDGSDRHRQPGDIAGYHQVRADQLIGQVGLSAVVNTDSKLYRIGIGSEELAGQPRLELSEAELHDQPGHPQHPALHA
jgi:hypothetical protein